jgi:two-component system cell cycle sensor histidine kinase/response regulator CckA
MSTFAEPTQSVADLPAETIRALRASDGLMSVFFESASIGIKVIDLRTWRLVDANPAFQRLLGYSLEELRSRPYVEFTHPDDREREAAVHLSLVNGSTDSFSLVKRYLREDGSSVPVRLTASVVRDEAGQLQFGLAMVEDVSRELGSEQARLAAEKHYRLIVETTMEGIWLVDADDRTAFANAAMASMLGCTAEEMEGRPLADFSDNPDEIEHAMARRRAGINEQVAVAFRRVDGTTLDTMLSVSSLFDEDGAYSGALGMVRDNTALRRSEDALATRVRQLEEIAELGREILAGRSLEEVYELVGPAVARALEVDLVAAAAVLPDGRLRRVAGFGWDGEAIGQTFDAEEAAQAHYQLTSGEKWLIVDDLQLEDRFTPSRILLDRGIRGGLSCRIEGGETPFGVLTVHTRAPRRFTEEDASFVDSVANLIGSVVRRDRSETLRRQAEEELRSTGARFRMLAENAQDIVFRYRMGENPGYEYVSPAVIAITGFTPEDFYRDRDLPMRRMAPEDVTKVAAMRDEPHDGRLLFQFTREDGTLVWLERRSSNVRDDHGNIVAMEGIIRDVSERVLQEERRRSLEEQLVQSQKLEAIGQLAGGIAHDFNNLLLGIRGFGELALRRLERGEPEAAGDIEEMLTAADRAADLTRQLLAFGRRQVLHPEVLDLGEVVTEMDRLLRRLIGERVELFTRCADGPVLVEADRGQLEQVVANLAVNARDAMPDGGRLVLDVQIAPDGKHAMLLVSDNGCGMDAETVARAFEPFFTTKGAYGTGFGLATVHGIISQSGGRISVESEPGRGTTFSIALPASAGVVAPAPAGPPVVADGVDTILVVEDDPMVRSIVKAMLEDRGYRVVVADSGEAALETVETLEGPIHLVLSDLVMPGLNGRETVDRLRGLRPGVRALFMSGYTDDAVIRGGSFEPGTSFIQKPFSADELNRRIRESLDVELV